MNLLTSILIFLVFTIQKRIVYVYWNAIIAG